MLSVNFTVQIQFIAVFVIYLGCLLPTGKSLPLPLT